MLGDEIMRLATYADKYFNLHCDYKDEYNDGGSIVSSARSIVSNTLIIKINKRG